VLAALLLRPVMLQRGTGMLLRLGAAACVVAMGVSIVAAAEFALSSDWIMLARTQLEPRTIGDGPFELSVPRGWTYEKPKAKSRVHVFQNPGTARFAVQILRTEDSAGPQAMLDQLVQSETQQGGELLFTTEGQLDEWRSYEAHVLYTRDSGNVRVRLMVLESASGHEVLVVCSCAERYYDLMHVIFDKMAQSIHLWPERPRHIDALSFWQRITRDSGDVEAAVSLARFYRSEGTPRPAEQMLLLALGVRKGYAPAHDELAYLYATASGEFRRPDEAVRHARQAVSLEPQNARYQATLAVALEAAGDLDAALTAARAAATLAPDDARYADLVARLTSTARRRR